jgi:hypothetical protein
MQVNSWCTVNVIISSYERSKPDFLVCFLHCTKPILRESPPLQSDKSWRLQILPNLIETSRRKCKHYVQIIRLIGNRLDPTDILQMYQILSFTIHLLSVTLFLNFLLQTYESSRSMIFIRSMYLKLSDAVITKPVSILYVPSSALHADCHVK